MIAKWTISIYLQASEAFYLCIEILGHVTWSGACAVEAEIAGAPPRADHSVLRGVGTPTKTCILETYQLLKYTFSVTQKRWNLKISLGRF